MVPGEPIGERVAVLENRVDFLSEDIRDIRDEVVPEMTKTMHEYAQQLREIRESLTVKDSKWSVIKSMAAWGFGTVQTVAIGYVLYLLTSK